MLGRCMESVLRKFYHKYVKKPQESRTRENDSSDATADQAPVNSENVSAQHVGKEVISTEKAKVTATRPEPEDKESIAEDPHDKSDTIGSHEVGDVGSIPQDQEKVNVTLQGQTDSKSEVGSEAENRDIERQRAEVELPHEAQNFEGGEKSSEERKAASEEEEATRPWTTRDTFNSLVQFFEATAMENLKPTKSGEHIFPVEIWEHILGYVSDVETFNACTKVSRILRSVCNQRPLVMDDLVLLRPRFRNSISDDQGINTMGQHAKADFQALQLSSGQQMDVNICSGQAQNNGTACRIVVGSEKNRKSFCKDCPISLQGFEIPASWDQNTRQLENVRATHTELEPEDKESSWNIAFANCPITAESPSRRLGYFWKGLFSSIADSYIKSSSNVYYPKSTLEDTSDKDWKIPPNTIQCLASQAPYSYGPSEESFHYLFLRLKRGCKFWDTLWDDIIREAKDYLASPDRTWVKVVDGQVVGAHDPYVLLIVGLEVRLFQWEQGFDGSVEGPARKLKSPSGSLKEMFPDKLFVITEREDRKVIEIKVRITILQIELVLIHIPATKLHF